MKRVEIIVGKQAYQVTEGQLRRLQESIAETMVGCDRDLMDACISHICAGRPNRWYRPGILGSPDWEHVDDRDYVVNKELED